MSVYIKLMRRRTTIEILEAPSAASTVSTKRGNFVNEVGPAASLILSEKRSTMRKKLVEAMASISCIYDENFRNLVEELELGAGEDTNGKVYIVLVDPP